MRRKVLVLIISLFFLLLIIGTGGVLYIISMVQKEDFSFQVLDAVDGSPIEGVKISVYERVYDKGYNSNPFLNDYQPYWEKLQRTFRTDEEGWGNISLKEVDEDDGYYLFRFEKEGYISFSEVSIFNEGYASDGWGSHEKVPCRVRFYSPANLTGVVRDTYGTPVEGVTVSVRFLNHEVDNYAVTDEDGRYRIDGTRAGETSLTISGPGIESGNLSVKLDKFQDNVFDPVVNRSIEDIYNISIQPVMEYGGQEVEIPDGDLVMFFIKNSNDNDIDYCWSSSELEDGNFNMKVHRGRYQLKWYYLGDQDYREVDVPILSDEYPSNEIIVSADISIEIDVELDQIYPDI